MEYGQYANLLIPTRGVEGERAKALYGRTSDVSTQIRRLSEPVLSASMICAASSRLQKSVGEPLADLQAICRSGAATARPRIAARRHMLYRVT